MDDSVVEALQFFEEEATQCWDDVTGTVDPAKVLARIKERIQKSAKSQVITEHEPSLVETLHALERLMKKNDYLFEQISRICPASV